MAEFFNRAVQFSLKMESWFGKIYFGLPFNAVSVPANLQWLKQHKRWARHEIPGRDGDVHDNMGSPSRAVRMKGLVSPEVMRSMNILEGNFGHSVENPLIILKTWNQMWLRGIRIPLISDPITTFVNIVDLDWQRTGGREGVYEFEMLVEESLPYSLSDVRAMALLVGLFALTGVISLTKSALGAGAINL